jgi:hypothetical protein
MAALEPTLVGRLDLVLKGTWRRVGAHPALCLDVKLVCRGTRSAGYRQQGPWEVLPKIRERPPSMLKMSMTGPLGVANGDPGVATINVKNIDNRSP